MGYPTTVPSLVTTRTSGNTIPASDHNDPAIEVVAIAGDLITARGAAANIAARLTAIDAAIAAAAAGEAINPKNAPYNAAFDGTTDDTAEINGALVDAAAQGRAVELPRGTAVIDPAVKLTMQNGVPLFSRHRTTLLMKPNSATTGGVWSILDVSEKTRWSVSGITFDGNRRNGNHGASEDIDGIHVAHSGYFEIAYNEFKNFRAEGILLAQQNPYSTGTASVTNGSATVTGVGTSWNSGGLGFPAVGQIFNVGSPLGRNYVIQAINSNTSITLTETYKGSTASGQSYAIAPPRPHNFAIHHNIISDCGVPVAGDANVVARQGIAAIAAEDFDISRNKLDVIGSVGVDLEPNLVTQIIRNGCVSHNRFNECLSFFINVAPAASGPASAATGLEISGNVGRGPVPKAYVLRATNSVVSGNVATECEQVGVQAVTEAGGASSGLVITDNLLVVTGPSPLAGVYLDSSTGCAVVGNVLPSTLGTAAVVEAGAANNNILGPNRIGHATDYVRVGAATQTLSARLLRFPGSDGRIEAAGGVLYLRSGAANDQIIFEKSSGAEDGRIDASGHLLMAGSRQVKVGGLNLATAVTAASVGNNTVFLDSADNQLKYKDNSGSVAQLVTSAIITKTTSYTLALADAGSIMEMNSASAQVFTIPPNSSVAFPIGTTIELVRLGAGTVTITPGAGVTIPNSIQGAGTASRTITSQYTSASLYKRATDQWVLSGSIT